MGPFLRSARPAGNPTWFIGIATLFALFVLAHPSPALANDTAVGGIGGDVYPLSSTVIRLEAETVQAVCYREFAEYRVDFRFVNEGEEQTLRLGFPFVVTVTDKFGMGNAPVAFRAWQDGAPLAVALGRGVSQDDLMSGNAPLGYYLHEATLPKGETTITVSYLARPTISAGSRFDLTPPEFAALGVTGWSAHHDYWLHTGAGWAGTIGTAVVRYQLADDFDGWAVDVTADEARAMGGGGGYNTTRPESYVKLDDHTYQWVFEDLEPTEADDVVLAFTTPVIGPDLGIAYPPEYGALAGTGATSGQLGPNTGMAAGWEAIDGSPATAWGFAAPGTGGWIRAEILGDQDLSEIRILPGKNDALDSFERYGRPKSVKVTLSDGTSEVITLADEPTLQKFAIAGEAEWVRFDVLDIYPGTQTADTYISEIGFGTEPAPSFEQFAELIAAQAPAATPSSTAQSSGTSLTPATTRSPGSATTTVPPSGSPPSTVAYGEVRREVPVRPVVELVLGAIIIVGVIVFVRRRKGQGRSN